MEVKTIQIDSNTFLVFKGREYRQININDIVCIKTSGKYSTIIDVHGNGIIVCCSLKNISRVLCIDFILATQGFLINRGTENFSGRLIEIGRASCRERV